MRANIIRHYHSEALLDRLQSMLEAQGMDANHPSIDGLAAFDHFHGRGLLATVELANSVQISAQDHLLDAGSGLGGPARYFANRFQCRVTGIDLTPEFCSVASTLSQRVGLSNKTHFVRGDVLRMPFARASFAGAFAMNVTMNILDKAGFYREAHRVLTPGGWFAVLEITRGQGGAQRYPTPWARTPETSFLATLEETDAELKASGFVVESSRITTEETLAYGALVREMVERGENPPTQAVHLIHGELGREMATNTLRGVTEGTLVPREILCRKPPGSDPPQFQG